MKTRGDKQDEGTTTRSSARGNNKVRIKRAAFVHWRKGDDVDDWSAGLDCSSPDTKNRVNDLARKPARRAKAAATSGKKLGVLSVPFDVRNWAPSSKKRKRTCDDNEVGPCADAILCCCGMPDSTMADPCLCVQLVQSDTKKDEKEGQEAKKPKEQKKRDDDDDGVMATLPLAPMLIYAPTSLFG